MVFRQARINLAEGLSSHLAPLDISKCADTSLFQTMLLKFHVVSLCCRSGWLAAHKNRRLQPSASAASQNIWRAARSAVYLCSSGLIHLQHWLHPPRWSWRRTWTPCCCRSFALWSGSTPSSPSYPGISFPELAPTWSGLSGSRHAQLVDTRQGLTGPSTAERSWWRGCIPGWTRWTKCLNTLRGGFHRETVWAPGRCSARRMRSSLMARFSRRWETPTTSCYSYTHAPDRASPCFILLLNVWPAKI